MRLSIFWRLALSSLAIVALMAGVNLYALSQIREMTALSTQLVSYHYPAIQSAQLLIANLYTQLRSEKQYLAVRDHVFLKNFDEEVDQFRQILEKVDLQESSKEGRKLLSDLGRLHEQYRLLFYGKANRRLQTAQDSGYESRRDGLITQMIGLLQTYSNQHEVKIATILTDARARSIHVETITRDLGILTLVLVLGLAGLASYSILRPLHRLQDQFRQIGRGNFSEPLEIDAPKDLKGLVDTANWMRRKLQELDNMKSDFLAHISHELRTPMASIREGTHLLLDEIPGPIRNDQRQILRIMNDSSERLLNLISTLLDLSKMEAGMMEYRIVPSDLKRVIENSINKMRLLAESKHIQILRDLPTVPIWASMDAPRIEQVLDNLLANAVKFSPNAAAITVRLQTNDATQLVEVSVCDTGPGIAAEDLPHIFDRFYQGRQHAPNKLAGSGLGLTLAKKVVEAHGGSIRIESEVGKGTTVHFTLSLGSTGRLS
jgi:two-component system sensor histidine kinase GlrK